MLAIIPSLANWGKTQIDNALGAAANIHTVTPDMIANMAQSGVLYHGLAFMGGGSILAGVTLGAIGAYIADRQFLKASGFAAAGAVLTFFGLMHGEHIGFMQTPEVAISYLIVSGILFACDYMMVPGTNPVPADEHVHSEEAGVLAS